MSSIITYSCGSMKFWVEGVLSDGASEEEIEAVLESLRRELDEEKREGILEEYELSLEK